MTTPMKPPRPGTGVWAVVASACFVVAAPASAQSLDLPVRTDENLLVSAWNIKWFKDPAHDLPKLATVIAQFDLCGIVELQSDTVLAQLAETLEDETGEPWTYIQSNRTGHAKYTEQFAFIWRDAKVRVASGHVGNVDDFPDTFRHEPYVASFRSGNFDFRFLLVHTRWTPKAKRAAEVQQIGEEFTFFQSLTRERDVVLAGDFNFRDGAPEMEPVKNATEGVVNLVPAGTKTTLKATGQGFSRWYDHVYVDADATTEATGSGGAYDFVTALGYTDNAQAITALSDHLPVWAEFRTDAEDDD